MYQKIKPILSKAIALSCIVFFASLSLGVSAQSSKLKSSKDFSGPGGPKSDPTVNPTTGEVSFSIPMPSLTGAGSPDYPNSISYSSIAVEVAAQVWNDESQSATIGLGWSINSPGRFRRDARGTGSVQDDEYYFNETRLVFVSTQDAETDIYKLKGVYDTRVIEFHRPVGKNSYWAVKDGSGNIAIYGGDDTKIVNPTTITSSALKKAYDILAYNQLPAVSNCAVGSVEYGIKWGNWMGAAASYTFRGVEQQQLEIAWNLSSLSDKWGNTTKLSYIQHIQNVGDDKRAKWYTKASYIYRVDAANNQSVQFFYCSRSQQGNTGGCDNIIGQRYADFNDPWTRRAEPDAYQERYDVLYLSEIAKFNNGADESTISSSSKFIYEYVAPGGDATIAKLMLKKVQLLEMGANSQKTVISRSATPTYIFEYYGPKDGLVVTRAGADKVTGLDNQKIYDANTGAVYGKIKSYTNPLGAKKIYKYQKLTFQEIKQDVPINPVLVTNRGVSYGNDYALVYAKEGAFIYTWTGRGWIETNLLSLGTIRTKSNTTDLYSSVYTARDFAIIQTNGGLYFIGRNIKNNLWNAPQQIGSNVAYFAASEKTVFYQNSNGTIGKFFYLGDDNNLVELPNPDPSTNYPDGRLVATENYFAITPVADVNNITYFPFNAKTHTLKPGKKIASAVNKNILAQLILIRRQSMDCSSGVTADNLVFEGISTEGDHWQNVTNLFGDGSNLYIQYPQGLFTYLDSKTYAEGNNGTENTSRIAHYSYDIEEEQMNYVFEPIRKKINSWSTWFTQPDGSESYGGVYCSRGYKASSAVTPWGVGHTFWLFSGRLPKFVADNSEYSAVATFPNDSSTLILWPDKGNNVEIDVPALGTFYSVGGNGHILPVMTKNNTAAYYAYDPHTQSWYNIGNSAMRAYTKVPESQAYKDWKIVGQVFNYLMLGLGLTSPEGIIATVVIMAAQLGIQAAIEANAPKSMFTIDPASFSIGQRYLNDANTLWYITHDGRLLPLGSDPTNVASVLTGFDGSANKVVSNGSSMGSTYIPFTLINKNNKQWGTYIRIIRNSDLGKYVFIRGGSSSDESAIGSQVFADVGDGATLSGGMFITYPKVDIDDVQKKDFLHSSGQAYLHKFMQDQASGNPSDFVVSGVNTEDGISSYKLEYDYNLSGAIFELGNGIYSDVAIYPGGKTSNNGFTKSYFYTGVSPLEPKINLVDGSSSSIVDPFSVINFVKGKSYKQEVYEYGKANPIAVSSQMMSVDQTNQLYSTTLLKQVNILDSQTSYQDFIYNSKRQLSSVAQSAVVSRIIGPKSVRNISIKTVKTTYKYAWEYMPDLAKTGLIDLISLTKKEVLMNGVPVNKKPTYVYTSYKDWGSGAFDVACNYYSVEGSTMQKTVKTINMNCPPPLETLPAKLLWETESAILQRMPTGEVIQAVDPRTDLYSTTRYVPSPNASGKANYPIASFTNKGDLMGTSDYGYNLYVGAEDYELITASGIKLTSTSRSFDYAYSGKQSFLINSGGIITYKSALLSQIDQPLVIGFWVRPEQATSKLSLNDKDMTASLKANQWVYIQTIVPASRPLLNISASGSGKLYVDDIMMHPLNGAKASASVYDFNKNVITDNLSTGGENAHHLIDEYRRVFATYSLANDGSDNIKASISPLMGYSRWDNWGQLSDKDSDTFNSLTPNALHQISSDESYGTFVRPSSLIDNPGNSFYYKIKPAYLADRNFISITANNGQSVQMTIIGTNLVVAMAGGYFKQIPLPKTSVDNILVVYIVNSLLIYCNDKLVYSFYGIKDFQPARLNCGIETTYAVFAKNPKVSSVYSDAFGRSLQKHILTANTDSNNISVQDVASAQIYDGWGNVAISSKLASITKSTTPCDNADDNIKLMGYCSSLISGFDWATYKTNGIQGLAKTYWDNQNEFIAFDKSTDGSYSYVSQEFTASPVDRNKKSSNNYGKVFSVDQPLGKNENFYSNNDAKRFFTLKTSTPLSVDSLNMVFNSNLTSFMVDTKPVYREMISARDLFGFSTSITSQWKDGVRTKSLITSHQAYFPLSSESQDDYVSAQYPPLSALNVDSTLVSRLQVQKDLSQINDFAKNFDLTYFTFTSISGQVYTLGFVTQGPYVIPQLQLIKGAPTAKDVPASLDDWQQKVATSGYVNLFFSMYKNYRIPAESRILLTPYIAPKTSTLLAMTNFGSLTQTVGTESVDGLFIMFRLSSYLTDITEKACPVVQKIGNDYEYQGAVPCDSLRFTRYNDSLAIRSVSDYGGRVLVSQEPDKPGSTYTFKDVMGRTVFICNNYNSQGGTSDGCLYYNYDHIGRIVESGTLKNVKGDVEYYLQKANAPSSISYASKCIKTRNVYDAAYDLSSAPLAVGGSPTVFMPEMKNMLGGLFAVINYQSNIPDKPNTSCGDTSIFTVNYFWNKGDQWDGMNVASSGITGPNDKKFTYRSTYYQSKLNTQKVAYPDRNVAQFEISDLQKRVVSIYDVFGNMFKVGEGNANVDTIVGKLYSSTYKYYVTGALKSYLFNNNKLKYEAKYDNLFRLRSIITTNASNGSIIFQEDLGYEANNSGSGYKGGNITKAAFYGAGMKLASGVDLSHSYSYDYDVFNRLVTATRKMTNGDLDKTYSYDYDGNGNFTGSTIYDRLGTLLSNQKYTYQSNSNRMIGIEDNAQGLNSRFTYGTNSTYSNDVGSITRIDNTISNVKGTNVSLVELVREPKTERILNSKSSLGEEVYVYDALGRLIKATTVPKK